MKAAIFIWVFVMAVMYYGIFIMKTGKQKAQPANVEYFKQGDTLLPDYVCTDTMIVIDASGLNKALAYIEQDFTKGSDSDYDSIIHTYCIKK